MKKLLTAAMAALLLLSGCGRDAGDAGNTGAALPADDPVPAEEMQSVEEARPDSPEEPPAEPASSLSGRFICVDPGHCVYTDNYYEPIAPGSDVTKIAFGGGTAGAVYTEEQLNLKVGLKLEQRLLEKGARVLMTRREAESDLSSIGRAKMANEAGVDLTLRIHADGSDDPNVSGMSVLVPTGEYIDDQELLDKSRRAGELVLEQAALASGAKNRGISPRSDMTGFNWSQVPVILLEMGFMSNPEEDGLLSQDGYQDKIADGIVKGLELYFESEDQETV